MNKLRGSFHSWQVPLLMVLFGMLFNDRWLRESEALSSENIRKFPFQLLRNEKGKTNFEENHDSANALKDYSDSTGIDTNFNLRYKFYYGANESQSLNAIFLQFSGLQSLEEFGRPEYLIEIARQLGALVLVIENRYIGKSRPGGDDQFEKYEKAKYLSTTQIIRDIGPVLAEIHDYFSVLKEKPLIAFGSGYTGLLAKWLQDNKLATYSVISSTPLFGFADTGIKSGDYEDQFFEIFEGKGGCNVTLMGAVFTAIEAAHDKSDYESINSGVFNVEDKIVAEGAETKEQAHEFRLKVDDLKFYLKNFLSEVIIDKNYPYPVGERRVGNPLKAFCAKLGETTDEDLTDYKKVLGKFRDAYNAISTEAEQKREHCVFLTSECNKIQSQQTKWFLKCTELAELTCLKEGDERLHYKYCSDPNSITDLGARLDKDCHRAMPKVISTEVVKVRFVAQNHPFKMSELENIVITIPEFSSNKAGAKNAELVSKDKKPSVYVFEIPNAVAHQDLMAIPNTCDSDGLNEERSRLVRILTCWIKGGGKPEDEACEGMSSMANPLAATVPAAGQECKNNLKGFPWWSEKDGKPIDKSGAFRASLIAVAPITLAAIIVTLFSSKF